MVGDMRNKLHVSLLAMVSKAFQNHLQDNQLRSFSKRIFFLVDATQIPVPSSGIFPPSPSYISIECMNSGQQVVKPGDGKRLERDVKKVYTVHYHF